MKHFLKLSFALLFAVILFAACSTEDNPIAPGDPGNGGDPDPIINTPVAMKIESISVTNFPTTKSNGDKWDYHVFPNSPTRRPDIYVELRPFGSSDHVFRSDVVEDAIIETAYDSFNFYEPGPSNGGTFPYSVSMSSTYVIDLLDDDGISADDLMGSVEVVPSIHYKNDNAVGFTKSLTSGDLRITIKGRWVY
ncbi:MAG: hypothetical protein OEM46_01100 [Ignavibacteria bacterium]|nr:hypothetical protein [Ignavibacteria bacterium]